MSALRHTAGQAAPEAGHVPRRRARGPRRARRPGLRSRPLRGHPLDQLGRAQARRRHPRTPAVVARRSRAGARGEGIVPAQDDGDRAARPRPRSSSSTPAASASRSRSARARCARAGGSSACSASSRTARSRLRPVPIRTSRRARTRSCTCLARGRSTEQIARGAAPEHRHRPQPRAADAARARRALADRGARDRASRGSPSLTRAQMTNLHQPGGRDAALPSRSCAVSSVPSRRTPKNAAG